MVLKDSRIKMMNEVLNGIKVYTVWCMCICQFGLLWMIVSFLTVIAVLQAHLFLSLIHI